MPEADLQRTILDYLAIKGNFAIRVNTQGVPLWDRSGFKGLRPSPMRGVSDILGVQKGTGRFFAIEAKDKYQKPTFEQLQFLEEVRKRGGIGIVAWSLEDVQA